MEEAAVVYADPGLSNSPLVYLSFQRNEQRKLKFLEGEPKALGITQICLIIFHASCFATLYGNDLSRNYLETPFFISSLFICIAGCVAVAAKNLHLPTLKACLGMELVASVASVFNLILALIQLESYDSCYYSDSDQVKQNCQNGEAARLHLVAEFVVIQVALFAISVTLTVYACKVVNCCSPAPKVPVITIQAPPAPQ